MTSFGETDLLIDSRRIGSVVVRQIGSSPAIYPRLTITLGITLYQDAKGAKAASALSNPYEMRGLDGELRLSQFTDVVGPLTWAAPKQYIQSSTSANERSVQLVCDLDFYRIEQIERVRNGTEPRFWLQLWPVLIGKTSYFNSDIRPFEMRVPREEWLKFYGAVGGGQFDIIEVQYSLRESERFKRAVMRLQEARSRITKGDYDAAVGACRKAIEVFEQELDGTNKEAVGSLLLARTDARRAKEYSGIVSRIKQLSGFEHHELGGPMTFSRSEAQFLVRSTEALAGLLGQFSIETP